QRHGHRRDLHSVPTRRSSDLHDVVAPPVYSRVFWDAYRAVNERFARAAADVADPGAVVWIQDYHLQLVPMILRRLRPDLKIGFLDRKSTRLNSSHVKISYAVF